MDVGSSFGADAEPSEALSQAKARSTGQPTVSRPEPCSTLRRVMTARWNRKRARVVVNHARGRPHCGAGSGDRSLPASPTRFPA